MLLALRFFSLNDIFLAPLCILLMFIVVRNKAEKFENRDIKHIYYQGFYFKIFFVFAYTFVTEFIFKGGDTGLYYQGVKDLRAALDDDFNNIGIIARSSSITLESPLAPYFYYDNYADDITINYMRNVSNFSIPRLGLIPSLFFLNSYLCMSLLFGFYAYAGSIRILKFFLYYYPSYRKELAIAAVFIPSVCFWSAGFLKDPICFGSIGFILYGVLNLFIKRKHFFISLLIIAVASLLISSLKVYILLAFLLSLVIWLFAETNKTIKDTTLRNVFSVLTFLMSIGISILLLNYFTSQEAAQNYKLDTLIEKSERQRQLLETANLQGSSGFKLNTSNPVALVLGSISATFFRPFLWEVNTPIALFSSLESLIFLLLTLNFFFRRGIKAYFKTIFSDPKLMMCFVFAIVFGIAVGASTTNFGALSRYKIPCMPFYFIMLLLVYKQARLEYPKWFNSILKRFR
jgi:hypothetical protein